MVSSPGRLPLWAGPAQSDTPPRDSPPCSLCRRRSRSRAAGHTPPSCCPPEGQAPPRSQVTDTSVLQSSAGTPPPRTAGTAHTEEGDRFPWLQHHVLCVRSIFTHLYLIVSQDPEMMHLFNERVHAADWRHKRSHRNTF